MDTKPITIIAVETSCDETSIAVVRCLGGLEDPHFEVLENLVLSQIDMHREFGGVVPNIAKREHLKALPILFEKVINNININSVDYFAVTVGPGLEPALWTGIEFMKDKSKEYNIPLIGANHIKGHLWSFLLDNRLDLSKIFPSIALVVSGGHTLLLKMDSLIAYEKIGETRDDAAGETFDKGARLLNLPYPGGPEISKIAEFGNPEFVDFPRPMAHRKNYDFSFAGLKTALLYYLKNAHKADWKEFNRFDDDIRDISSLPKEDRERLADISASFEAAIIDSLAIKTIRAVNDFSAQSIVISGGVAANKLLRKTLQQKASQLGIDFFAPGMRFNTDNAAMIAVSGYMDMVMKKTNPLEANGNLEIN